jgi:hypothetical protein
LRIAALVALDEVAGDDRMAVQACRQRRHTHAVVEAELQRLHALPHVGVFVLPARAVGVVGEGTEVCECVVDITPTIVLDQRVVFGQRGGNPDLLRPPVQIDADRVFRKDHERADAGMRVVERFCVGVAAGGGAEREQARPVAAVAPDRKICSHDDAEAVAQRVQTFDPRHVIHQAERVTVGVELAAVQTRPRNSVARKPAFKAGVAPLTFGSVDRVVAAVAGVEQL